MLVTLFGLIMIYPLVWMFMSSFKDTNTIFTTATQLIPETFKFENYANGWKGFGGISFGTFFGNSLFISILATIGTVFSSAIVGYGLQRCKFKGSRILFVAMLLSMMLPAQVLMIPQYLWYQQLPSADRSVLLCDPGILRIPCDELYRRYPERAG